MSKAQFNFDFLVYDDAEATNYPQEVVLNYQKQLDVASMAEASNFNDVLATGNHTISVPNPSNYIFIVTDRTIKVRFNGMSGDEIDVSPTVAGTKDGILFKRGAFTSLVINVPGVTSANVKIFYGV